MVYRLKYKSLLVGTRLTLSGIDPAFIAASFRQGREKGSKFFAYDLFVKTRFEFFAHFFHVFGLM